MLHTKPMSTTHQTHPAPEGGASLRQASETPLTFHLMWRRCVAIGAPSTRQLQHGRSHRPRRSACQYRAPLETPRLIRPSAHQLCLAACFRPRQLGDESLRLAGTPSLHIERQDNKVSSAVSRVSSLPCVGELILRPLHPAAQPFAWPSRQARRALTSVVSTAS